MDSLKTKLEISGITLLSLDEISYKPVSELNKKSFILPDNKPGIFFLHSSNKLLVLPFWVLYDYKNDVFVARARFLVLFHAYGKWNHLTTEKSVPIYRHDKKKALRMASYLRSLIKKMSFSNLEDFYSDDDEIILNAAEDLGDFLGNELRKV